MWSREPRRTSNTSGFSNFSASRLAEMTHRPTRSPFLSSLPRSVTSLPHAPHQNLRGTVEAQRLLDRLWDQARILDPASGAAGDVPHSRYAMLPISLVVGFVARDPSEQDQIAHHLDMAHEAVLLGLEHRTQGDIFLQAAAQRGARCALRSTAPGSCTRRRCAPPARSVSSSRAR